MKHLIVLSGLSILLGCQHHKPQPPSAPPAEATPAEATPVALPIGISACDDYLRRVAACQKLSPAARAAFTRGAGAWKAAGATAARSCEDVARAASAQLAELGC